MNRYKLTYTALFYDDLMNAVNYIENTLNNPTAANKLIENVEKAILSRSASSVSFQPYPLSHEHKEPYYAIRTGNYLIFM